MLNQLVSFDRETKFILACSGGVESMAIADFYKKGNKIFALAYFNHATSQASSMEDFVRSYADKNKLEGLLVLHYVTT
jgi:tRNA(Ile)-lysidine synthase TilS/MesJ